jgi:hypothetical protein
MSVDLDLNAISERPVSHDVAVKCDRQMVRRMRSVQTDIDRHLWNRVETRVDSDVVRRGWRGER